MGAQRPAVDILDELHRPRIEVHGRRGIVALRPAQLHSIIVLVVVLRIIQPRGDSDVALESPGVARFFVHFFVEGALILRARAVADGGVQYRIGREESVDGSVARGRSPKGGGSRG